MIRVRHRGNFNNTENFFKRIKEQRYLKKLDKFGREGVEALSLATPVLTGLTASSWTYEIEHSKDGLAIRWLNTNVNKYVNIAIILQYGHGTGTGGYVQGRDYINPAIQPVFDKIAEDVWKEVVGL